MKETLTKYKFFTPDNYDKEEQFLHYMSLKGWHFKSFSFISYTFEKGQPKSYSYKLDFLKDKKVDKENLVTMYEDFGWEHIYKFPVFGGEWEYFRKESETGQEEALFTDNESKIELLSRIKKFYLWVMIFALGINLINIVNIINNFAQGYIYLAILWIALIFFYIKIQTRISLKINSLKKNHHN